MLSVVAATYNRSDLIRVTINSLLAQDKVREIDWEYLVVDDGSTDDLQPVLELAQARGLPVRSVRINQSRYPEGTWKSADGQNNPAVALNVGIREAKGDRIVLTSPEIIWLRPGNLARLAGWDLPPETMLVGDVWDETMRVFICGGAPMRPLHFLTMYWKADLEALGGFDERYLVGRAFEDSDFCERWRRSGRRIVGSGPCILAQHPAHARPEYEGDEAFVTPFKANQELYIEVLRDQARDWVANRGGEWGAASFVEGRWPTPSSASA